MRHAAIALALLLGLAARAQAVDFTVAGLAVNQIVTGPLRVNAVPSADTVTPSFTFSLLNVASTVLQSNQEGLAPFCFIGDPGALPCNAYNTASRPDGAYTLRILMRHSGGMLTKDIPFTVANSAPAQPPGKGVLTALRVDVVSWSLEWGWAGPNGALTIPELERSTAGGPFTSVAPLAAGATAYEDRTVFAGQAYCYRLRGRIDIQVTPYSNEVCTP